eukprot:357811-Chlamydomonas_euryale.AAC.19
MWLLRSKVWHMGGYQARIGLPYVRPASAKRCLDSGSAFDQILPWGSTSLELNSGLNGAQSSSRLAGWGWYGVAQDVAQWCAFCVCAQPAARPPLTCCAQHRHTLRGSAPCKSDSDSDSNSGRACRDATHCSHFDYGTVGCNSAFSTSASQVWCINKDTCGPPVRRTGPMTSRGQGPALVWRFVRSYSGAPLDGAHPQPHQEVSFPPQREFGRTRLPILWCTAGRGAHTTLPEGLLPAKTRVWGDQTAHTPVHSRTRCTRHCLEATLLPAMRVRSRVPSGAACSS